MLEYCVKTKIFISEILSYKPETRVEQVLKLIKYYISKQTKLMADFFQTTNCGKTRRVIVILVILGVKNCVDLTYVLCDFLYYLREPTSEPEVRPKNLLC